MADKFVRGARVRGANVLEAAAALALAMQPKRLTLGECVFCLMDLRAQHYSEINKEQLLELISKSWDAYAEARKHG